MPTESTQPAIDARTSAAWPNYAGALALTTAATLVSLLIVRWLDLANLVMVYLLGATTAALWLGRGPAALAAVLNVLAFDYFFVPPRYTLDVANLQYVVTFVVMLGVALLIAELAANVRAKTQAANVARLAAEKEALRSTLLSSISHDLRTPLATIAGAANLLADESLQLDTASRLQLASSIDRKARDMSALVSNVLELLRMEGHPDLRRDWQDVDELAGGALERAADALAGHPVEVSIPADLPSVHVDAQLITQLLANLLENVARHTPAGTPASVTAHAEGQQLAITVADRGPGLPPGDPGRLFEKFQRGRAESAAGGAGLGLAICQAIARAHGGEVTAQACPGGGAQFTVRLPLTGPMASGPAT